MSTPIATPGSEETQETESRARQKTTKARSKKTWTVRTPARTEKTQSEPQPEPQHPR